ncbi:cellulose biosynthesis protein [Bordetella ansorpii]|uniref:Cellulose biosynthesis protein n=1 Tax=Bordetella ansorpii TaxID=288768 RepID=A0A157S8N4_9BORD|nr:SGNH/GDSL hydrolase family protein [Bordetella ansorpii]SAI66767.1 cellulose biosynthesis protein [Bordetella ansorpii]
MLASALAGLTILVVGDSHLGYPGYLIDTLHDNLLANGAKQVHTVSVCGSNPGDWVAATQGNCGGAERLGKAPLVQKQSASTTPITQLVAADKPDLVVIVMGDTIGGYGKDVFPKTWAWQQTTALTKALASTKTACVWVGPPWGSEGGKYNKTFSRVQQVSSFLATNVSPCTYIDSTKMAKPGEWGSTDGQHLTTTAYKYWGKDIADAIIQLPGVTKPKP